MKGSASSSSSSRLEMNGGCGRRKKYARGIVSGRTYETMAISKAQQRSEEFLLMTTPRPLVHQGFGAPTKGMRQLARRHLFQKRNTWIRRKPSDQPHHWFSRKTYPTLRPAITGTYVVDSCRKVSSPRPNPWLSSATVERKRG